MSARFFSVAGRLQSRLRVTPCGNQLALRYFSQLSLMLDLTQAKRRKQRAPEFLRVTGHQ